MPTIAIAGPRAQPVSRTYVKQHCKVTVTDDDTLLDAWIRTATSDIEAETWRQLITATYDYSFDAFPICGGFLVPRAPLRKVESITYLDSAGNLQTLSASVYRVVRQGDIEPGFIELTYGQTWPSTYPVANAVTVRFVAGYATPFSADAPTDVVTAPGHTYIDGEVLRVSTLDNALPTGLALEADYYARDVVAGASLKLAATAGGAAIDLTTNGTGANFLGCVPPPLLQSIALLIRHFDANREPLLIGSIVAELPLSIRALTSPYSLANRL